MKTIKKTIDGYGTITISRGNSKMGKVINWSLLPGATCSKEACKTCYKQGCYARKLQRIYPIVDKAWRENTITLHLLEGSGKLYKFVEAWKEVLAKVKPDAVRIHVSGDFYSRDYLKTWCVIADQMPSTKFFAFTKQLASLKGVKLPDNLSIIASEWKGCKIPRSVLAKYPVAHVIEHGERVPVRKGVTTEMCKGDCSSCHLCFSLKRGTDVAFLKH